MLYVGYYFPSSTLRIRNGLPKTNLPALDNLLLTLDQPGKPLSDTHRSESNPSYEDVVANDFQFDISGHDVMVFLHIQKTGGTTFGRHLVRDLDLQRGCQCHSKVRKRCTCLRPGPHSTETWLFSRYSTGWQCGLHADWTELTACVDDTMNVLEASNIRRKYYYITFLRDPVHRFLSEFRHVKRGATWKNARLACGGRSATRTKLANELLSAHNFQEEIGSCYDGAVWDHLTLEKFMSCPHNLAINRQTRMLAGKRW
ncbi:Sulfotransferase [Trinorchestia longiramus]|nr:Sulfotransferase [Trinorchestia longiramus]